MLLSLVGKREPNNSLKKHVASYFDCPVFQFKDLSDQLFDSFAGIYGLYPFTTIKVREELKLLLRENLTKFSPSTYIDWMSGQLVEKIFKKQENSSKKIQGIILDVETPREYKTLRTYMLSPKFGKHNKFLLVENEEVAYNYYNKGYDAYNEFEVDGCISNEDENIDKIIQGLLKKWHLESSRAPAVVSN